ncbi:probable leucine--tRNA ligase, mitochondrial [Danaus plexippus]|uniref:probable leucine--tRNA ligase, mitochondrial n=1 Tax=Danaus plexippus TaxID=13037 RepID=UPI002AB004B3|nr:probable leucine--tRNA ligase, mitochondrial [Danaus plexippus]
MSIMKSCRNLLLKEKTLLFHRFSRYKSCLGLWEQDISTEIKLNIERHWSPEVLANEKLITNENKVYILSMFPYPSGNLHMGHVRVYSISDSIARIQKLQGKNVIHPIGWDAFGLPAENAALERNILPQKWTDSNIKAMKNQLLQLGLNFDWEREISTCNPDYYKWTQYIFLKLFENGLAYQSKAKVNWDPVDNTVLADEQVDDNGCSWRSGAKVEKKTLTQWFIKTTKYAKQLYDGLSSDSLENWKDIINLQKHWIGECDGVVVSFKVKIKNKVQHLEIWSSEPYKFIHGDYIFMKKDNAMLQELSHEEINNLKCYNPVSEKEISVYVCDDVNYPEGRDVYIASPSVDADDYKLIRCLNIPLDIQRIDINCNKENEKGIKLAQSKKVGGYYSSSKLKDWLISRQRYWGTPIPIIHCPSCGAVPVPYEDLPVVLPEKKTDEASLSLSSIESWVNCKCPQCSGNARRECDTMDTFVDSSWYYYRYLDPQNKQAPFNIKSLAGVTPVNCYIGGKEHAVLHLYYARFMSYFLHSIGLTPTQEPFKKLLVQGMIMGQSYKVKSTGKYIPPDEVEQVGKGYKEKATGETVLAQWEKMSKSKFNGENPQRLLTEYGCDTTRLLILSDVPPETSRKWSDATLPGALNWQHRLWRTIREFLKHRNNPELFNNTTLGSQVEEFDTRTWNSRNYFIATATYHFLHTQKLSVGISRLQSLTAILRNNVPPLVVANSKEFELALANLIVMLSPITPHFCSELWAGFLSAPHRLSNNIDAIDWNKEVLQQKWPKVDSKYPLSFLCKVDGADRCDLKIIGHELNNMTEEKALEIMLKEKLVKDRIKTDIIKTKYELYPDCRAILHIFTERSAKVKKNKIDEELKRSQA